MRAQVNDQASRMPLSTFAERNTGSAGRRGAGRRVQTPMPITDYARLHACRRARQNNRGVAMPPRGRWLQAW
jgi:hypothetical protein